MKLFSFLRLATVVLLLLCFSSVAQAQTMDEIMKEMAEAAKKGEQSQYSGTYNNYANELTGQQNTYQPLTKKQGEQLTTQRLLRTLSEVSKKPEGETRAQRQDRLTNFTNELRDERAAISQKENEYHQARIKRLMGGGSSNATTTPPPTSQYERDRRNRMGAAAGGEANPSTTAPQPAGFGEGYAGGFKNIDQTEDVSGIATNPSRAAGMDNNTGTGSGGISVDEVSIDDIDSLDVEKKEPVSPSPRGCQCLGNDTYIYGICHTSKERAKLYKGGGLAEPRPWTSSCHPTADTWRHLGGSK